jgi:hypothetical protein
VLFTADFSTYRPGSFVPPPWSAATPTWSIVTDSGRNVLQGQGTYAVISAQPAGASAWSNYTVTATVKAATSNRGMVLARYQNKDFYYGCGLDPNGFLTMGYRYAGAWQALRTTPFDHSIGYYTVTFTVNGSNLTCQATNGSRSATLTATATYFSTGSVGAWSTTMAQYGSFQVVRIG